MSRRPFGLGELPSSDPPPLARVGRRFIRTVYVVEGMGSDEPWFVNLVDAIRYAADMPPAPMESAPAPPLDDPGPESA